MAKHAAYKKPKHALPLTRLLLGRNAHDWSQVISQKILEL